MSERFQLVLSTRVHEWTDELLGRVLRRFSSAGWIARPQWMQTNWRGQRRPLASKVRTDEAADAILGLVPRNTTRARALDVGGTETDWALHLTLGPWLPGADRIAGVHVLALDLPTTVDRASLVPVFEGVVSEQVAEHGWLHEVSSGERLLRTTARNPAYTGQFFPCFAWCNYLGPTILDQFAPEATASCLPHGVRKTWLSASVGPEQGLVLVTTPTPEEAASPEGERALLVMTNCFRAMRRN